MIQTKMRATCPHCQTNFKITMTELAYRDGLVRCGVCHEKFDASIQLKVSALTEASASKKKASSPIIRRKSAISGMSAISAASVSEAALQQATESRSALDTKQHKTGDDASIHQFQEFNAKQSSSSDHQQDQTKELPSIKKAAAYSPNFKTTHFSGSTQEQRHQNIKNDPTVDHRMTQVMGTKTEPALKDFQSDLQKKRQRLKQAAQANGSSMSQQPKPDSQDKSAKADAPDLTAHFDDSPQAALRVGQETLGVIDKSQKNQVLSKRGMQILQTAAVFILVLLLLAQSLFYFRVEVATYLKSARPWLVRFCAMAGCEVPWPKNISLMAIVHSEMFALDAHSRVIVIQLENKAGFAQQYPVIEVELMNSNEKVVLRQHLLPQDYLLDSSDNTTFRTRSKQLVNLKVTSTEDNILGYRLTLY